MWPFTYCFVLYRGPGTGEALTPGCGALSCRAVRCFFSRALQNLPRMRHPPRSPRRCTSPPPRPPHRLYPHVPTPHYQIVGSFAWLCLCLSPEGSAFPNVVSQRIFACHDSLHRVCHWTRLMHYLTGLLCGPGKESPRHGVVSILYIATCMETV